MNNSSELNKLPRFIGIVLQDQEIGFMEFRLLSAIMANTDENGICAESRESLSEIARLDVNRFSYLATKLSKKGLITKFRVPQGGTLYELNLELIKQ